MIPREKSTAKLAVTAALAVQNRRSAPARHRTMTPDLGEQERRR
jgi:hypothetical protein